MWFLTIWNVKSAVTCESEWLPSRKSLYFGISKLILYFPYYFHVPCTMLFMYHVLLCTWMYHLPYFSLCTFTLQFPCFAFFVIDRTRKQTLLIKRFNFVFIKDLPSISQSNEKVVKAENGEQYSLSNVICIKLQNCCFFSLRCILEEVLLHKPI